MHLINKVKQIVAKMKYVVIKTHHAASKPYTKQVNLVSKLWKISITL